MSLNGITFITRYLWSSLFVSHSKWNYLSYHASKIMAPNLNSHRIFFRPNRTGCTGHQSSAICFLRFDLLLWHRLHLLLSSSTCGSKGARLYIYLLVYIGLTYRQDCFFFASRNKGMALKHLYTLPPPHPNADYSFTNHDKSCLFLFYNALVLAINLSIAISNVPSYKYVK
jgi:hypothetical protein